MALFRQERAGKLLSIKEEIIKKERDLQRLTEANLKTLFGLELVSSEFERNGLRIDTLCFDPENKSFVVIEYKKDRSFSVIDQGFAYLALLVNNKGEFLQEYNEKKKKFLTKDSVSWSPRVLFVAPFFTPHQKAAINFKGLPIELWEVKSYEDNVIEFKQIEPLDTSEKIETVTGSKLIREVSREIKAYDLELHLKKGSDLTRGIFENLKERILELGEMTEIYRLLYVGYQMPDRRLNFVTIHFYKEKLQVYVLVDKLEDPKKITEKIPPSYGWAKNLRRFDLRAEKEIPYALELIRQAYEFNKER